MRIQVLFSWDTKEKIFDILTLGGYQSMKESDTRLPRLGCQITSINLDLERYTGKNVERPLQLQIENDNVTNYVHDLQPVPIVISYTLSIWAKYYSHWTQIVANIIPYFDPYLTIGVRERDLGIERDIKVELIGISPNAQFETSMAGGEKRLIRGEMTFDVKTCSYKQKIDDPSSIIQRSKVYIADLNTPISSELISISAGEL
jgi:hypothetical protein